MGEGLRPELGDGRSSGRGSCRRGGTGTVPAGLLPPGSGLSAAARAGKEEGACWSLVDGLHSSLGVAARAGGCPSAGAAC